MIVVVWLRQQEHTAKRFQKVLFIKDLIIFFSFIIPNAKNSTQEPKMLKHGLMAKSFSLSTRRNWKRSLYQVNFNLKQLFYVFRINEGGLKYFASTGGLEV